MWFARSRMVWGEEVCIRRGGEEGYMGCVCEHMDSVT